MSQTELNYSVSTVNNKNGTPFILVKQSAGDSNSIIDPYGLKLYRDNGNDPHVPLEPILKEHDTPTIDFELNTASPKSSQEGKQLTVAKNITLNDQCLESAISKISDKDLKEEEEILTRNDIAKLFHVSLVTINEWCRKGILKPHHMNSRVYFYKSETMEILSASKYGRRVK